ncbi:hypothetical protein RFI_18796 [Reticulomyxa filosa]|uniref:Dynein heavy chain coiled coil stalk domain-containing protein n=1 Tax=Reticulomyxa filosa TaxID=46433 RepID=X6MZI1_RETFI|nr:hypothetical protein RFI_18796 [Reticulomyxa filosa]|eukprot:ETO18470.1 hypothetical protein RFI_18796 [Reticulomyxa filosa]
MLQKILYTFFAFFFFLNSVMMQSSVTQLAEVFLQNARFHTYVTPMSYMSLLRTFQSLYEATKKKIGTAKERYDIGLEKLQSTQVQVKEMQQQLEGLQPKLEESVKKTNELMAEIQVKTKDADTKKEAVVVEERQCNQQASAAREVEEQCQEQLDKAMPAYLEAMKALKVIKKADLAQVKKYTKPPPGVILTMEALCIMFQVPPKKVLDSNGKKVEDYWEAAKKDVLSDTKLLEKLETFDKDNISEAIITQVGPYLQNPEFEVSFKLFQYNSKKKKKLFKLVAYSFSFNFFLCSRIQKKLLARENRHC